MTMKPTNGSTVAGWLGLLLIAALSITGCGKGGSPGTASKSFDAAPPAIKSVWDAAVAADSKNDFVTAVDGYRKLVAQQDSLSKDQRQAVEEAQGRIFQRLTDAASKGDAAARAALMALQPGRR
jgi:hypothetical protein